MCRSHCHYNLFGKAKPTPQPSGWDSDRFGCYQGCGNPVGNCPATSDGARDLDESTQHLKGRPRASGAPPGHCFTITFQDIVVRKDIWILNEKLRTFQSQACGVFLAAVAVPALDVRNSQ